ncbi:MAG TPA: flippase activity-associated protein Agl23, partial [Ardenticatenaceae bacterium]
MMEIEQPVTTIPIRRTDWLDRPLASFVTLDRATLVLGAILLLTVVSRFWDLGSRALHHDESLHAVYSYYLYDQGRYIHEPLMHGPVLFHLTALGYWLFGDSDFTARLWPAILGVVTAWLPWKYRSWLGEKGALFTSFLVLISPSILYYSRFIREDIFALTWTAIIVYGLYKYLEGGEDFHLYVMTAGWALLFSQKEISFLFAFIFWTFLALVLLLRRIGRLGPRVPLREAREWHILVLLGALLLPHATALVLHLPTRLNEALGLALPNLDPGTVGGNSETSVFNSAATWPTTYKIRAYLTALLLGLAGFGLAARLWSWRKFLVVLTIFYTIFLLFHTTFLTNLHGVGSGMIGALGYWIEQHEVQRGEQPWYYYSMLLPLYEFLPLLLGLGGAAIVLARRRNGTISPEVGEPHHLNTRALWPWFNLWWFFGAFVIFSYAGEKMPWLLVHMAFPVITLAGWAMGKFLDNVAWERLRGGNALWFTLLFLVAAIAALNLIW